MTAVLLAYADLARAQRFFVDALGFVEEWTAHDDAAAAGAEILVPPADRPWGRDHELRDGEGDVFSFFS